MLWYGIIEASQGIEVKPEVVASMKSALMGYSRTCLRGASIVVVGSGVTDEWNGCGTAE